MAESVAEMENKNDQLSHAQAVARLQGQSQQKQPKTAELF